MNRRKMERKTVKGGRERKKDERKYSTTEVLLLLPDYLPTSTMGINIGRISSPNTFERISRAAALHLRKFHIFTMSSS